MFPTLHPLYSLCCKYYLFYILSSIKGIFICDAYSQISEKNPSRHVFTFILSYIQKETDFFAPHFFEIKNIDQMCHTMDGYFISIWIIAIT